MVLLGIVHRGIPCPSPSPCPHGRADLFVILSEGSFLCHPERGPPRPESKDPLTSPETVSDFGGSFDFARLRRAPLRMTKRESVRSGDDEKQRSLGMTKRSGALSPSAHNAWMGGIPNS